MNISFYDTINLNANCIVCYKYHKYGFVRICSKFSNNNFHNSNNDFQKLLYYQKCFYKNRIKKCLFGLFYFRTMVRTLILIFLYKKIRFFIFNIIFLKFIIINKELFNLAVTIRIQQVTIIKTQKCVL